MVGSERYIHALVEFLFQARNTLTVTQEVSPLHLLLLDNRNSSTASAHACRSGNGVHGWQGHNFEGEQTRR